MKVSPTVLSALRCIITAACLSGASFNSIRADVVTDWNVAMTHYSEIQPPPGVAPFVEARAYAMAHIAMRDAISKNNANRGGTAGGAVAQPPHAVLVAVFPGGAAVFDALLATQLSFIPADDAKWKGIQIGAAEAAQIL